MSGAPLRPEPLTAAAFAPFGEVLEDKTARRVLSINQNTATRFGDLANADLTREGGRPMLSLFRAAPRPLILEMLECHPLGAQMFMPARPADWLVVVASGKDAPVLAEMRCFRARGFQGVNYNPGAWHHPLLVLEEGQDFWVLDRGAPPEESENANLREFWFKETPRQIKL